MDNRVCEKAARCAVDEICPIRRLQAQLDALVSAISLTVRPSGVRLFLTDFVITPYFCKALSRCYECAPLRNARTLRTADTRERQPAAGEGAPRAAAPNFCSLLFAKATLDRPIITTCYNNPPKPIPEKFLKEFEETFFKMFPQQKTKPRRDQQKIRAQTRKKHKDQL